MELPSIRKIILLTTILFTWNSSAQSASPYNIGTGIYDITGPAAENGFFGYSNWEQQAQGLHTRLRAHAYIIESNQSDNRVAFVSADQGMISQGVKIEVIKRLNTLYGNTYTAKNVMLSATHTHVGAGGSSHYSLFEIASASKAMVIGGYSAENFNAVVQGIVNAISRAHNTMSPGTVELVQGELNGATRNRSLPAYENNEAHSSFKSQTNSTMTVLKFKKDNGKEIGMINWFAVHPTGFSNQWQYLSADISGYAQQQFEQRKGTNFTQDETFVAAFASSDLGDSVIVDGNANSRGDFKGSADEVANAAAGGTRLFEQGWYLYNQAGLVLNGSIDFRHRWADMENYNVSSVFTGSENSKLCSAARGFSFVGGAENGPSDIPGIYEGMTTETATLGAALESFNQSTLGGIVNLLFSGVNLGVDDPCQYPKPVLLPTGQLNWVPETLPFQIFVVGELAIVGAPGEITTMAGRHIRADVLSALRSQGVNHVVIAGLANTYSGYIATKDEYQKQHYEGASTVYGPNTLAAYRQEFTQLASAISNGQSVLDDKQPLDRLHEWRSERPGVVWDGKYIWEQFGQVKTDAKPRYQRGETVKVSYRGGHPKNNLRTQDTFLKVQRKHGNSWITIADDNNWNTLYRWNREGGDRSLIDITWHINEGIESGHYRIVHLGNWKNGWSGAIKPYTGVSRTFWVE